MRLAYAGLFLMDRVELGAVMDDLPCLKRHGSIEANCDDFPEPASPTMPISRSLYERCR